MQIASFVSKPTIYCFTRLLLPLLPLPWYEVTKVFDNLRLKFKFSNNNSVRMRIFPIHFCFEAHQLLAMIFEKSKAQSAKIELLIR